MQVDIEQIKRWLKSQNKTIQDIDMNDYCAKCGYPREAQHAYGVLSEDVVHSVLYHPFVEKPRVSNLPYAT